MKDKIICFFDNVFKYMKVPLKFLLIGLLVGVIAGSFILDPDIQSKGKFLQSDGQEFLSIFYNNALIIISLYISIAFTNYYAYFVYIWNGITLGIYIMWIIKSNIILIMLLIPHGIFEIPCILFTGYILEKGSIYIQKNFKKYIFILIMHVMFVAFCAMIETFVTLHLNIGF